MASDKASAFVTKQLQPFNPVYGSKCWTVLGGAVGPVAPFAFGAKRASRFCSLVGCVWHVGTCFRLGCFVELCICIIQCIVRAGDLTSRCTWLSNVCAGKFLFGQS